MPEVTKNPRMIFHAKSNDLSSKVWRELGKQGIKAARCSVSPAEYEADFSCQVMVA